MVRCHGQKSNEKCNKALRRCKSCGHIGCSWGAASECTGQGFVSGRCLKCGDLAPWWVFAVMLTKKELLPEDGSAIDLLRSWCSVQESDEQIIFRTHNVQIYFRAREALAGSDIWYEENKPY